jgi:hypothetical protein
MKASRRGNLALVTSWIVLVIGITSIPFFVGLQHSTKEMRFTGLLSIVPMDHCTHLAWAKQAYDGDLLLENKFNGNEIKTRLVINVLFLIIGWMGRLAGIPMVVAFHLVRIVVSILLLCVIYQFTSLFLRSNKWKWFALALVSTSAGFGWAEMLVESIRSNTISSGIYRPFSIDTVAVEVSTIWHLRWEVVTTPTVLLLTAVFWLGLRSFETDSTKYALGAAVTALVLGLVHPHNLFTIYLVFFLYTLIRTRHVLPIRLRTWRLLLLVFGFSAPTLAYNWYVIQQEPLLWSYIDLQDRFEIVPLLFGYGLPGLFALLGCALVAYRRQRELYFPALWVICALTMLHIPVSPLGQVFTLDGLHIPICILATIGVMWPIQWLDEQLVRKGFQSIARRALLGGALVIVVLVASLTNVLKLVNETVLATGRTDAPFMDPFFKGAIGNFGYGIGENRPASPYFMPGDLCAAFDWLDKQTDHSEVVLSRAYLSCFVPYQSGNRVYYGHPDLTVDSQTKSAQIDMFFTRQGTRSGRRAFLLEQRIGYILFRANRRLDEGEVKKFAKSMQEDVLATLVYHNRRSLVFKTFQRTGNE